MTISEKIIRKRVDVEGLRAGPVTIDAVPLFYEEYKTSPSASKTAVIFPFFLGSAHAAGQEVVDESGKKIDARPGYWDHLIGPGAAIDTNVYRVISFEPVVNDRFNPALCRPGSTERYASNFPVYTIADYVELYRRALNVLGVSHAHLLAGASMGSIQAIQMALTHPQSFDKLLVMVPGTFFLGEKTTALVAGWVKELEADPAWNGGNYAPDKPPKTALRKVLTEFWFRAIYPESSLLAWNADDAKAYNQAMDEMLLGSDDEVPLKRMFEEHLQYLKEKVATPKELLEAEVGKFRTYVKSVESLIKITDHNVLLWQLRSLLGSTLCSFRGKSMLAMLARGDDLLPAHELASLEGLFKARGGQAVIVEPFTEITHNAGLRLASPKDPSALGAESHVREYLKAIPGPAKL